MDAMDQIFGSVVINVCTCFIIYKNFPDFGLNWFEIVGFLDLFQFWSKGKKAFMLFDSLAYQPARDFERLSGDSLEILRRFWKILWRFSRDFWEIPGRFSGQPWRSKISFDLVFLSNSPSNQSRNKKTFLKNDLHTFVFHE